jgi:hypothetical protein
MKLDSWVSQCFRAPSELTGDAVFIIFVNSDRCGAFGAYWAERILVAEACNHPNCLSLPFRLELIRLAA